MAATRVGVRLARRLASATGPPCALEPSTNAFLLYGAPKRFLSSTAAATGEAPPATGAAARATGAAAGATGAAEGATRAAAETTAARDAYLLYGAPTAAPKRCFSTSSAGATDATAGTTGARDAYLLFGAPTAAPKRCFSTASAGASGGKPGAPDATAGATSVTDAAAAATGGVASGATGAASGATDASGVILKPLVKITTEDMINEWKSSAGFRKALYIAASALVGASAATISLAYMENRLSNKLAVGLAQLNDGLAAAQREDIERRNAAESKETERRESAERQDKQRREDWARNIQLLVNDILSKIIKLEEKEWKNRHAVLHAEEILKRFGFSSDVESYYEVAKQFQMLQFQVDYLKSELSKQKETPAELLQSIADIDSQLTALKKRIVELDIARGADSIQTGKGVTSNQSVKKK